MVFLLFAVFWTTTASFGTYTNYTRLENILIDNQYKIAERAVKNFDLMPHSGHKDESFEVNGVMFAYSDYNVSNAFNNTKSHGGPIDVNSYVRIYYAEDGEKNPILKLWIRDYKGPIKDCSSGIGSMFRNFGRHEENLPPDVKNKSFDKLLWYSNLFVVVLAIDFIAIVLFFTPLWKTYIPLRKRMNLDIDVPNTFKRDGKFAYSNILYKWDTNDGFIWMRPKGLNMFHVPFTITKWTLNQSQEKIIKEDTCISSGLIASLIIMYFSAVSLINASANIPCKIDYVLIAFFLPLL